MYSAIIHGKPVLTCGVVVIIMANIVAKNWEFFLQIAQNVANSNFIYLRDPTKYSKYLRLVLMS